MFPPPVLQPNEVANTLCGYKALEKEVGAQTGPDVLVSSTVVGMQLKTVMTDRVMLIHLNSHRLLRPKLKWTDFFFLIFLKERMSDKIF